MQASLLVALSGILYGFLGFLGTKILDENMNISSMLFWRFIIAGVWMLPFIVKNKSVKKILQLDKKILFFTLILGAIGYAGSCGFYFIACETIGTGLAMVIFFSYPIIIALTAWLTRKSSFNMITLIILMTMMVGLFLLKDPSDNSVNMVGILFAIGAAASYAFYIIGTKKYSSLTLDSSSQTLLVSVGSALIFLLLALKTHTFMFPSSLKSWMYLLGLGILVTGLPIQLMLEGLKQITSMRASIISVLEPLVTVFVGVFLLEESLSYMQMMGVVIILGSAIVIQFQREL